LLLFTGGYGIALQFTESVVEQVKCLLPSLLRRPQGTILAKLLTDSHAGCFSCAALDASIARLEKKN